MILTITTPDGQKAEVELPDVPDDAYVADLLIYAKVHENHGRQYGVAYGTTDDTDEVTAAGLKALAGDTAWWAERTTPLYQMCDDPDCEDCQSLREDDDEDAEADTDTED